jgi:hypothetical protein
MSASVDDVKLVALDYPWDNEELAYVFNYSYNGKLFAVMVSTDPPEGCQTEAAIEEAWVTRLDELSWHDGSDRARLTEQWYGGDAIVREVASAVFPTLKRLAPSPPYQGNLLPRQSRSTSSRTASSSSW